MGPGRGLPIGSGLSQWCANLYLDGLDHFIKRELKVRAYLRYMDDFVLFSDDRGKLLEARGAVREWLGRERRLALNPKRWQVHEARQPSTWLGYRVSPSGLVMGKAARRRMKGRLRVAADKGPQALERSLRSYAAIARFG